MSSAEVERCRAAIKEMEKHGLAVPLIKHMNLCDALKKCKQNEEAVSYYKALLKKPDQFTENELGLINHEIGSCYVNMHDFIAARTYLTRASKYIHLGDSDFPNLASDIEIAKRYQKTQLEIQQLEKKLRLIRERGGALGTEDKISFVTLALEATELRRSYGDVTPEHFIPLFKECEDMLPGVEGSCYYFARLYFYWNEVLYENREYDDSSEVLSKLLSVLTACDTDDISDRRASLARCLLAMANTRAKKALEKEDSDDSDEEIVMEVYDRAANEVKGCAIDAANSNDNNDIEECKDIMYNICLGKAGFYSEKGNTQKYEEWLTEASKYKTADDDSDSEEEEEEEEEEEGESSSSSSSSSSDSDNGEDEDENIDRSDDKKNQNQIVKMKPSKPEQKGSEDNTTTKDKGGDEEMKVTKAKDEIDTPAAKRSRLDEIVREKKDREKRVKESLQFSSSKYDEEGNLKPCFREDFFDNDLGETFEDEDDGGIGNDDESNSSSSSDDDDSIFISSETTPAGDSKYYRKERFTKKTTVPSVTATVPTKTTSNNNNNNNLNLLDRYISITPTSTQTNKLQPKSLPSPHQPPKQVVVVQQPQKPQKPSPLPLPKPIIVQQPTVAPKRRSLKSFFEAQKQQQPSEESVLTQKQQQRHQPQPQTSNSNNNNNDNNGPNIIVQVDIDIYGFSTRFAINSGQSIGDIARKASERYELTRRQRLAIGMDLELRGAVLVEDDPIAGLVHSGDTLKLVPRAVTPDTPGVNPRVRTAVSSASVGAISLAGTKLDELSFRALCGALPSLTALARLDLRGCGLCSGQALALSTALQQQGPETLRELDVSHNPLECSASPTELRGIASLFYVATLDSLDISSARLTPRTLGVLANEAATIVGVPNVRSLDVSGNTLGPDLSLFVRAMSHLTRLCELRARSTFQRCDNCNGNSSSSALKDRFPSSLRGLRFSGNVLGDAGTTVLAAALPPGIRFVETADCGMGSAGAGELVRSGAEALDVSNNDVGTGLANALSGSCAGKLAALKASHCSLGVVGLSTTLRAAAGCCSLAVLILDENVPVGAGQCQVNTLASKCFPQLAFLDMSRNGVAKEDADAMVELWRKAHDGTSSPYGGLRVTNATVTDSALVFGDRSVWQRLTQDSTKRKKD